MVNNQAPELSTEARRIISEARGADDPTADDQARVKARWLASVAAIAGVSSLTEAARAAGGIGWGFKAAGAALVVAASVIGLYVVLPSHGEAPAEQPGAADGSGRGAPHARFEKTPAGEHAALSKAAASKPALTKGGSEGNAERAGSGLVDGAPAQEAPSAALPAVAAVPTPPVTAIEAAPAAPSIPKPTATPMLAGDSDGVEVGDPGTEAAVAPSGASAGSRPLATNGARSTKGARRERVPSRGSRGKAPRVSAVQRPAAVPEAEPVSAAAAVSNAQSGQLGEELALLSEVRSSVQDGAPARALELLGRYRSQFGRPILGMEADALKVDALCKAGQREAARASAQAFQKDWPGSPLERRVSSACP